MLEELILQIEGTSAIMIGIIGISLGLIGGVIGWKIWEEKTYEERTRQLKIFIILGIITIIPMLEIGITGSEGIIFLAYMFVISGIFGGKVIGARLKEPIIGYLSGGFLGGILFAMTIRLHPDPFLLFLVFIGYFFIILGILGGILAGGKWENRWVGGILGGALGGFFTLMFGGIVYEALFLLSLLLPIGVTISSVLGFITHHRIVENNQKMKEREQLLEKIPESSYGDIAWVKELISERQSVDEKIETFTSVGIECEELEQKTTKIDESFEKGNLHLVEDELERLKTEIEEKKEIYNERYEDIQKDRHRELSVYAVLEIIAISAGLIMIIFSDLVDSLMSLIMLLGYLFIVFGILGGTLSGLKWKNKRMGILLGGFLGAYSFTILFFTVFETEIYHQDGWWGLFGKTFLILPLSVALSAGIGYLTHHWISRKTQELINKRKLKETIPELSSEDVDWARDLISKKQDIEDQIEMFTTDELKCEELKREIEKIDETLEEGNLEEAEDMLEVLEEDVNWADVLIYQRQELKDKIERFAHASIEVEVLEQKIEDIDNNLEEIQLEEAEGKLEELEELVEEKENNLNPKLSIDVSHGTIEENTWTPVTFIIQNKGNMDAGNIEFDFGGSLEVDRTLKVDYLEVGEEIRKELKVKSDSRGSVPFEIETSFEGALEGKSFQEIFRPDVIVGMEMEEKRKDSEVTESKKIYRDEEEIRSRISSIQHEEEMIDVREVETALKENDVERAGELLAELEDKYQEYKRTRDKLKELDNRKSQLAERLAEGEIDRNNFEDAMEGIKDKKYDLENKLESLRKDVIYEDYEKPF